MAKRGPKPRRKLPMADPLTGIPDKPDWLDPIASEEWDRLVAILTERRVLSRADGMALALLCSTYGSWRTAVSELAKAGPTTETATGAPKQSPEALAANQHGEASPDLAPRVRTDSGIPTHDRAPSWTCIRTPLASFSGRSRSGCGADQAFLTRPSKQDRPTRRLALSMGTVELTEDQVAVIQPTGLKINLGLHFWRIDAIPLSTREWRSVMADSSGDEGRVEADPRMIGDLIEDLPQDPWREANPFSPDMQECHDVLFRAGSTRAEMAESLDYWLASQQPCLFGRMEAKQKRLAYCLLTENDLERGDDHVRMRIQEDRDAWRQRARSGESHGFIILAISPLIARATVGPELLTLARHLCDLYLGRTTWTGSCLMNSFWRSRPNGPRVSYVEVGVNYFSAQGDGLWWRDHRIPGGMAFSMNSVGHMARTKAEVMLGRNPGLADGCRDVPRERLTYWALPTAMKTIGPPVEASTRGTWLAERGQIPRGSRAADFRSATQGLR